MVIFDLDGTLTVPVLDFDAIRAEIGLPPGPILEALAALPEARRRDALAILDNHEREAAEGAIPQPGARETVRQIRAAGWPVAILTRNTRRWSTLVIERFELEIDALRTRDDGVIKPSPEPIYALCKQLSADPCASWMIGDHRFDLLSGSAAGCKTVLMIGDRPPPEYAAEANFMVTTLPQIPALIFSDL
jgi:HAD superfamily hydrolase (TIGR01509 family)